MGGGRKQRGRMFGGKTKFIASWAKGAEKLTDGARHIIMEAVAGVEVARFRWV